jgi:hypothetical protein
MLGVLAGCPPMFLSIVTRMYVEERTTDVVNF